MLRMSAALLYVIYHSSIGGTGSTFFATRAEQPIATLKAGIFLVTTAPAPIVQPSPIWTPAKMVTFDPIQQSLPIEISFANSTPSRRD